MRWLVIEAPGKIQTLRKAAEKAWPGMSVRVLATGGLLRDLPTDKLGVNLQTMEPSEEKWLDNGDRFNAYIQNLLQQSPRPDPNKWDIWVMTDPDREGEGIARQVWDILERNGLDVRAKRVYITDISADGLSSAVVADQPHAGMVVSRTARRVLDRLIPKALAFTARVPDWKGFGRIQTAALRVISEKQSLWKKYEITGNPLAGYQSGWTMSWRTNDKTEGYEVVKALRALNPESCVVKTKVIKIDAPHAHSAATLLQAMLSWHPEDVAKAAQEAYIAGRVSYPRTDHGQLFNHQKRMMGHLAQEMHLGSRLKQGWFQEDDEDGKSSCDKFAQGAHPGLHPTISILDAYPKGYSEQAQEVEREIWARALATMMEPATIRKSMIDVEVEGRIIPLEKVEIIEPGWTLAYERMDLDNPLLPPETTRDVRMNESYPTARDVVRWLHDEGMGRPSTLAAIPRRLHENGLLSPMSTVTRKGMDMLHAVEIGCYPITQAHYTQTAEKGLAWLVDHPDHYKPMMMTLMEKAGFDVSLLYKLQDVDHRTPVRTGELLHTSSASA
jgi:DNA topoisomerase IA